MHILKPDKDISELLKTQEGKTLTILDYDGTIAPFKVNRYEAYPDPGLLNLVKKLTDLFPEFITTIISGRAAREVQKLTGGIKNLVIWGNHGWEKIDTEGNYKSFQPSKSISEALKLALSIAEKHGIVANCEVKLASLALHTRGMEKEKTNRIREWVYSNWGKIAEEASISLVEFNGGFELIDRSRHKGTAVEETISEIENLARACYIGDDRTDEDAFIAINNVGLSVLLSDTIRDTNADIIVESRDELREFLERWITGSG